MPSAIACSAFHFLHLATSVGSDEIDPRSDGIPIHATSAAETDARPMVLASTRGQVGECAVAVCPSTDEEVEAAVTVDVPGRDTDRVATKARSAPLVGRGEGTVTKVFEESVLVLRSECDADRCI